MRMKLLTMLPVIIALQACDQLDSCNDVIRDDVKQYGQPEQFFEYRDGNNQRVKDFWWYSLGFGKAYTFHDIGCDVDNFSFTPIID